MRDAQGRYLLSIKGTPGHWYLATLNDSPSNRTAIDAGQGWVVTNMHRLLDEANFAAAEDSRQRRDVPERELQATERELRRAARPRLTEAEFERSQIRGRAALAPGFPSPVPYAAPEMEFTKGEWRPLELDDHDRDRSTGESLVEQDARERFSKLEFNPGTPPRGAIKKYLEFHDRDPKATGWLNLKIPSSMGHVGEAKTTYYKSDKWSGKQTNYFHEHDGRVRFCTTESEARKGGADWSPVHLPEFITKTKAIILLGKWMGCDYENGDADVEVRPAGTEELYTIPSGKALIVVASKRAVVAVLWGGTLDVKDVGIVG